MRRPAARVKPRLADIKSFAAPVGGLIRNRNIAERVPGAPQGAALLTNWIPTATGAELRGGSLKYATLGAADKDVTSFLRYKNGTRQFLFAAIEDAIYDITSIADPDISPAASVTGLTSGEWSSTQFATTGGVFLVAVNGRDSMRMFDHFGKGRDGFVVGILKEEYRFGLHS